MWCDCCQSFLSSGDCFFLMNAYKQTTTWLDNCPKVITSHDSFQYPNSVVPDAEPHGVLDGSSIKPSKAEWIMLEPCLLQPCFQSPNSVMPDAGPHQRPGQPRHIVCVYLLLCVYSIYIYICVYLYVYMCIYIYIYVIVRLYLCNVMPDAGPHLEPIYIYIYI